MILNKKDIKFLYFKMENIEKVFGYNGFVKGLSDILLNKYTTETLEQLEQFFDEDYITIEDFIKLDRICNILKIEKMILC